MPLDMLMDLYDAHGIPPETVVEIASDNFTVNVPDNFFTLVAGAHEKDTSNKRNPLKLIILKQIYYSTKILIRKNLKQKF